MAKETGHVSAERSEVDEGSKFTGQFANLFSRNSGAHEHVAQRQSAERKAGATQKQRARKAKRTVRLHFRTTPEISAQLDKLAAAYDCSRTLALDKVIERAFAQLEAANADGGHS